MEQRQHQGILARIRENGLRRTAVEVIGGKWYQERDERIAGIIDATYQRGPALITPHNVLKQLGEIDSRLIDLLIRQQGWKVLSGMTVGTQLTFTEQDRLRVVWESRYYYHYDVQVKNAVDMWTDFGFGQSVKVVPQDDQAKEVWDTFWTNPRNKPILRQRDIAQQSNQLVKDGEAFYEFTADGVDGSVVIRRVLTEEIIDILYEDEDRDIPLFYVRNTNRGNVYYPDHEARRSYADRLDAYWDEQAKPGGKIPAGALRADQMPDVVEMKVDVNKKEQSRRASDVVMQQVAINKEGGRGWPQLHQAIAWADALRHFVENRATVARAVAAFVDEAIVDQGSRGIDAVKSKFNSTLATGTDYVEGNPPAAAGSWLVHNKAVDVRRRPLTTGASDAESDAMLMVGQLSAGTKIPPHFMGYPGAMQNRATAKESSRPFDKQMERYQTTWADVFKEWVEIVLWFAELYGGYDFTTYEAVVTLDAPLDLDIADVSALVTAIVAAAPSVDPEVARVALERLIIVGLADLGIRELKPVELEQSGDAPPEEPEGETPEVPEAAIDKVTRMILENARSGVIDWQTVAEFAVAEMAESVVI